MPDPPTSTEQNSPPPPSFLTRCIATGFFSGYSPVIPGTAGSLVGLLVYTIPGLENVVALASAVAVGFCIGVLTSRKMEQQYGEDPQIVVIDEVVGMWISLFMLQKTLMIGVCAFVLFRIYDTVKPPPARQLERYKHGWGIMLDDVAAGIYANLTVRLLLLLFPGIA